MTCISTSVLFVYIQTVNIALFLIYKTLYNSKIGCSKRMYPCGKSAKGVLKDNDYNNLYNKNYGR